MNSPRRKQRLGRWRRGMADAALAAMSLLLVAAAGECATRMLYPWVANYNMEMWRYFAIFKEIHDNPAMPFTLKPDMSARLYGTEVRTNHLGLRGGDVAEEPAAGVTRIAMLGDSQTFGWGIREEDTIAASLERRLNAGPGRYEVINFGVGNYNSMMTVEQFFRKGLALRPAVVVLNYFVNDAEAPQYVPRWRFSITRRLYLFALAWDAMAKVRSHLALEQTWLDYYRNLYAPSNPWLEPNREALHRLIAECRGRGIKLILANYPDLHELDPYPLDIATEFIRGVAVEHGVPFVDFTPRLRGYDPVSLWVSGEDPHGNATVTGHAADALAEAIQTLP